MVGRSAMLVRFGPIAPDAFSIRSTVWQATQPRWVKSFIPLLGSPGTPGARSRSETIARAAATRGGAGCGGRHPARAATRASSAVARTALARKQREKRGEDLREPMRRHCRTNPDAL